MYKSTDKQESEILKKLDAVGNQVEVGDHIVTLDNEKILRGEVVSIDTSVMTVMLANNKEVSFLPNNVVKMAIDTLGKAQKAWVKFILA
jgi:phosphotransferase system IIA component